MSHAAPVIHFWSQRWKAGLFFVAASFTVFQDIWQSKEDDMLDSAHVIVITEPEKGSDALLRKIEVGRGSRPAPDLFQTCRLVIAQFWDGSTSPPTPYVHILVRVAVDIPLVKKCGDDVVEHASFLPQGAGNVLRVSGDAERVFQRIFEVLHQEKKFAA